MNIKTACCELMDIFEVSINTTKDLSKKIIEAGADVPIELKESIRDTWVSGAEHFSFLLVDKLWKEDRLCKERCEIIYNKLGKNMDKYYPKLIIN